MTSLAHNVVRLLRRSAAEQSLTIAAEAIRERPWSSALFLGNRLTISIASEDDARLDKWLIALPEIDLPLSRHFVASGEVIERHAKAATVDLLIVEG